MSWSSRLHTRLGDFWWYSFLLFVALRCGDLINAFIGLWLVPKYVPQSELGAVLPLTQITSFFGLPLSILCITFTKFLNQYYTLGEMGKVKSLIRTFWGFAVIAVLIGTTVALFLMPHFFERIRVEKGSLGILIIAVAVLGTTAPVFTNALQALKRFRALTIMNLLCSPIRLVVMLVAMPFRALSGYMLGQVVPCAFQIVWSWFSLRKAIGNDIVATPFLKDDGKCIIRYFSFMTLSFLSGLGVQIVFPIIIRQRLPEVESAAYYMISRFSELATFVGQTIVFVMFPFVSEAAVKSQSKFPLLLKSTVVIFIFGILCGLAFCFIGDDLLGVIKVWSQYVGHGYNMGILAFALTLGSISSLLVTYESAIGRFSFILFQGVISWSYAIIIVCFSGYSFFNGLLPFNVVSWMASWKMNSLNNLLLSYLVYNFVLMAVLFIYVAFRESKLSIHRK